MKILFITQVHPFPLSGGDNIRVAGILKALSQFATVDLVLIGVEPARRTAITEALLHSCVASITYFKDQIEWGYVFKNLKPIASDLQFFREIAANKCPDLIWLDYGYIAHYRAAFPDYKVIFDTHNVESSLLQQRINLTRNFVKKLSRTLLWQAGKHYEHKHLPSCDVVITTSHTDLEYYQQFIPLDRLVVIPNFIDLHLYKEQHDPQTIGSARIIFTGNMGSFQNQQAGDFLLTLIWPFITKAVPECELFLVGKNPPAHWLQLQHPKVHVTGAVESVIPFLKSSTLAIVPLLHGSGTRLKILEAMACGVPVVSTSVGCEGLEATDGADIVIADQAEMLAQRSIELLQSPQRRALMTLKAQQLVQEKYSLEANRIKLQHLCQQLMNEF